MINLFQKKQVDPKVTKEKELKKRLEEFAGSEGLTTKNLDLGLWYIKHRRHFFLGTVGVLGLVAIMLWGSSLYYFGSYVLNGMVAQKQALLGLTEDSLVTQHVDYTANLKYQFLKALPLEGSRHDLIGSVTNANEGHGLYFDYYFVVNGQTTTQQTGFVYPNENKFLLSLNQVLAGQPAAAELVLENLRWFKIDTHEIADWSSYKLEHLNFPIKDKSFVGSDSSGLTENLKFNQLSFLIENQTAYSYYEVPLSIVAYNGQDNIVAVTRHVLKNFTSRQQEQVSLSLLGYVPKVSRLDIQPDIDILDQKNYKPLQ